MFNQHTPHAGDFIERARARIDRMELVAGEVTDALGLPREAKYEVMAAAADRQSAHDETPVLANSLQPSSAEAPGQWSQEKPQHISGHTPARRGRRPYWIATLAAAIVAALLVGSLVIVLNMAKQSKLASQVHVASASPVPGIYIAGSEGVYRLVQHDGKMTQQWFYKLSAPRAEAAVNSERSPFPIAFGLIDTPVTVVGDTAYFGGMEDDGVHNPHHYLYALDAQNGSLLWRHQIDGGDSGIASPYIYENQSSFAVALDSGKAISAPLVWHDLIYIDVFSSQTDYIIALDRNNGAMRWAYKYTYPDLGWTGGIGIQNGLIYVTVNNLLIALRADTGHEQWSTPIQQELPGGNYPYLQTPQIVNGVVYVAYPVDVGNAGYTSKIYAFNAANGAPLWHSMVVNDQVFTPTINDGVVYVATDSGTIYALRAQDGTQLWKENAGGSILAAPQIVDGRLYMLHTSSQYRLPPPNGQTQVMVFDASQGTRVATYNTKTGRWFSGVSSLLVQNGAIYAIVQGWWYILRASDGRPLPTFALDTAAIFHLIVVS